MDSPGTFSLSFSVGSEHDAAAGSLDQMSLSDLLRLHEGGFSVRGMQSPPRPDALPGILEGPSLAAYFGDEFPLNLPTASGDLLDLPPPQALPRSSPEGSKATPAGGPKVDPLRRFSADTPRDPPRKPAGPKSRQQARPVKRVDEFSRFLSELMCEEEEAREELGGGKRGPTGTFEDAPAVPSFDTDADRRLLAEVLESLSAVGGDAPMATASIALSTGKAMSVLFTQPLPMPYVTCRPMFSGLAGLAVFGAELDPEHYRIVLLNTSMSASCATGRPPWILGPRLPKPLYDMASIPGENRVLFAIGNGLAVCTLPDEMPTDSVPLDLTKMKLYEAHSDSIREARVNELNQSLVASGGYDCMVAFTDVNYLTGLGCCLASGVVGSVRWKPSDASVVSWTTDVGYLQVYDTRRGEVVQSTLIGKSVYSHEHSDSFLTACGTQSGEYCTVDARMATAPSQFLKDSIGAIGDLVVGPTHTTGRTQIASFGSDGFSVLNMMNARATVEVESYCRCEHGGVVPASAGHHRSVGAWVPEHLSSTLGDAILIDNCGEVKLVARTKE